MRASKLSHIPNSIDYNWPRWHRDPTRTHSLMPKSSHFLQHVQLRCPHSRRGSPQQRSIVALVQSLHIPFVHCPPHQSKHTIAMFQPHKECSKPIRQSLVEKPAIVLPTINIQQRSQLPSLHSSLFPLPSTVHLHLHTPQKNHTHEKEDKRK